MPQQPAGLQREACCSTPTSHRWSTWQSGVGAMIPVQREGERGHTLPQDKHGELQERADDIRWVVSGRAGDSIRQSVDGGVGSGIGSL